MQDLEFAMMGKNVDYDKAVLVEQAPRPATPTKVEHEGHDDALSESSIFALTPEN
jgi:hypothetical protein